MPSKPTKIQMSKSLDNLMVTIDVQARAIRMTREQRQRAREIMQFILKADKK